MALKDNVDKVLTNVKDTVKVLKDDASEAMHKGAAEAEQHKREVAGDSMTAGEKASSLISQVKNTVQGKVDALKSDVRKET
jgi:hypothetical protein